MMFPAEADLGFLQAGVPELKDYLLSDQLFWPLGGRLHSGGGALPSLTLGGLLLAQARLGAVLPAGKQRDLSSLVHEINRVKYRWRSAWARKADREFSSRLRQWQNFIEDYRRNPDAQGDYYPQEVRLRVILALLGGELNDENNQEPTLLEALDRQLERTFEKGEFIWDPALEETFPQDPYWYLYGRVK